MDKYESNLAMYERVAKKMGLNCEYIYSSHKKKPLLISDGKKFFLINTGTPGFYPNVKRFNAHFTSNKILTQEILQKFNYRVIVTTPVHIENYASKEALLTELDTKNRHFPLLLKPNKGQDGNGITICETQAQLHATCAALFEARQDFLIQPIITQSEYRILVVDDEVVLMHSKRNQSVIGDGVSSIETLLSKVPASKKSSVVINWQHVKKHTNKDTILPNGEHFEYHITKIPSKDVYYTENFPPAVVTWALKLASTISAPVVGIDVFIPDDISHTDSYTIIELNSNPAVYYLPKRCNDIETPYRIIEKVLKNHFNLS